MELERKITKDTLIGEILHVEPALAEILFSMGMHCVGCPSAQRETLEEACFVHGVDPDDIVNRMNAMLEA